MEKKILVAYATTHGATREVAQAVGDALQERGLAVEVQAARDVRSLAGYGAVVLGAPLYMFRLHRDARAFLGRHRKALEGGLPIAVFAGGPFGESSEKDWQDVRKNLEGELGKFAWLRPAAVEVVGGKFDPAHLRFPWNLIPAMRSLPPGDLRDWDAIRAWAHGLAEVFQSGA